jgi:hypothetical protein
MREGAKQGAASWEDHAWAAAEVVASAIDVATGGAYHVNQGRQGLEALVKGGQEVKKARGAKPSPRFVANGFGGAPSPVTQAYLKSRAWKSIGGTVVSVAGGGASAVTGINVGSTARHGSALGTTGAHLAAISSIAMSAQADNPIVADWCRVIIRQKAAKVAARGMETASSAIPVPMAGPIIKIFATLAKLGIKMTAPEVCFAAAIEIHWAAFCEQRGTAGRPSFLKMGGGGGKKAKLDTAGPASKIFQEMFTRRGMTSVFGAYDIASLVTEPGGWMALGDKISMA